MSDIHQDTSTAFVVYVPPNGSDTTVESCLRLGASPAVSTADESKTYADAVAVANKVDVLASQTYSTSPGIALVTPGTINLVAAGGVNASCGNYSNSTFGPSYTVTQDGSLVVNATYTHQGVDTLGLWSTVSFNQASNVAVNFVPIQASFATTLLANYALQGPVVLSNNYGLMWSSTLGWSVTAQMARVINIGWRTVVANAKDGSNNQYYTKDQAANTAQGFSWTVPKKDKYKDFDTWQEKYCRLVNKLALATDALAIVYSAIGLGIAEAGHPKTVQGWLTVAEPMAIVCAAADVILASMGLWMGAWVDTQAANTVANAGATSLVLGDGTGVLKTGDDKAAPAVSVIAKTKQVTLSADDPDKGNMLCVDGDCGVFLGKWDKALVSVTDDGLMLKFGNTVSIFLSSDGIVLNAGTHSVNIEDSGISISGQKVTIEAAMAEIDALQTQLAAAQKGVTAANKAAAEASKVAQQAVGTATKLKKEVEAALRKLKETADAATAAAAGAANATPAPTP
jgi:hypothetical protein